MICPLADLSSVDFSFHLKNADTFLNKLINRQSCELLTDLQKLAYLILSGVEGTAASGK